ncbi:magnesium/cobalt transporter CorA [Dehalogenimonas etheniformans]|uniref:Magnesium transport protein CorA n=1 Tax=Dehalogenimonas etheniformans TaxID=1536648 RepID=A0A2P5P5X8_9CHLR|nr:magnesium/cobalt transporter CorA [Dehalogenimonas etheniformans]PPD57706.1 magnesium and cobalt transport protein CorA [Dehalogenimonas etheniformans]QNT76046.1 magnesium/cobalt transporter CorA [Dehalogenimonas etheniformans]
MARRVKRSEKAGLPPGTLIHIGERRSEKTRLRLFDYDESQLLEKDLGSVEEAFPFRDTATVTWINVDGLQDTATVEQLGKHFGLHPLVLEDIVNTEQRPKFEDFETYFYVVLKMLYRDPKGEIEAEQVSLILGNNFILSFQEGGGDAFESIRERLRKNKGMLRKLGADSLLYALIDAIVDNYFGVLESFGEITDDLEENVLVSPTTATLATIKTLKGELLFLRRSIWPMREVVSGLRNSESTLIKPNTRIYFQDVYDHVIQVMDGVDNSREILSDLLDIYLSSVSNRLNEVIKVLTIIATIFIPLTFIAGVYGMNFDFMPELRWHWGYFIVLGIMATAAINLLLFFRRKKWI